MYNFQGVPSEDEGMVPPAGTIAVFNIDDVKQENCDGAPGAWIPKAGEKVYISIFFSGDEGKFDERFYMLDWDTTANQHKPHGSMKRMQHLFKHLNDQELGNGTTFEQIKAGLVGKQVALAIGANIRETEEGPKAFSQIKYMNFARKPHEIGELAFSNRDKEEIDKYKAIRASQSSSNADAATPAPGAQQVPFAGGNVTPDNKF